ncbi:FxsA family protein [Bacillus sp. T33-2]|uniref:FxsA family protein n=1 Tax=Bacillus sp. T33-2 TaxID=2054168 RepID=UPI000C7746D6|nr:FxsA family protein [Bacillus sp. T33-2]PLR98119.1 membrane protein FxsA [Bacillus sp. T33-2]
MRYFLLFLIIVPAAEIGLLLLSGRTIGVWPTILMIIGTGFLGAYLAKRQGLETIRKAQEQLRQGRMPGETVLDGICILVGGTLLLTPGFVTDLLGLLLLVPPTRKFFKMMMLKAFRKWINKGNITILH